MLLKTAAEIAREEADKEKKRESNRRKLQLIFNCIVAFTSALTVAVLCYQAVIMSRTLSQVGIQSVAAKTSADAANKNALAAEQAAHAAQDGAAAAVQGIDVTVKQFHSDQRAWIFISNYTMSSEPEGDGFVLITCHVINSGKKLPLY